MPSSPRARRTSPWTAALVVSVVYAAVGACWILLSGLLAARVALQAHDLASIETIKGLGYVAVTAALLGLGIAWVLRQRALLEQETAAWRDATAKAERQAVAGVLAASVAHDINNVLMILSNADEDPVALRDGLERLRALATRLQAVGRPDLPEPLESIVLSEVLQDLAHFVRGHRHLAGRQIVVSVPATTVVLVPRLLFERTVINLLLNAGEASVDVEPRTILLSVVVDGPHVRLVVEDGGPGLPQASAHLLEAGSTTRARGSGLGLLTLQALAERLGGRPVLERSTTLGGACVGLWWDAAALRHTQSASAGSA